MPESVHMGDPAGGYVEMLKARNSARGHLMAWSEKRAMQEYLKELTENSNLNREEYGTVMSSEANEIGLEKLLENFLEGGPPEILRRVDACTCYGGSIPGSSLHENRSASTVGLVLDGHQEGGI